MPRRSPGEIRAQLPLPYRIKRGNRAVIRGLSSSANRQIAQFERANGLRPGDVSRAFRAWAEASPRISPRAEHSYGYGTTSWGDMHARTLLEAVLHAMTSKGRREMARAIDPLDRRFLASTVNDPFTPAYLPWWRRRICE
jgi:hypothetical protein